jgi:murein DD-endopeptidase MepM/ murein hydrolase activator NlpD
VLYNGLVFGADLAEGDEVFLPGAKSLPVIKKDTSKDTKITAKTTTKKVATTKKDTMSATTAISKIKRFAGKYSDLPVYDGYYANPAPSARRSQKMHGANAVDLAAPIGTDIFAAAPGTVSVAKSTGWNYGYGQYIVITHPNGTQTVYAHLSNINVSVGQSVSRGQKIGDMGSTGNSTGPHVHFEVRGAYNPFAW